MNIIQGDFPTPQKDYYKVYVQSCTFNQASYIEDCLNGVAMQETNFPFVHHVIDDASTDGEQQVIKAWMDKNCDMEHAEHYNNDLCTITLVKNKKNHNCTLALYFLKKNLYREPEKKGTLIKIWQEVAPYEAICEGDDYWTNPHKLQKQMDYMEAHPDCMLTFHRAQCKWEGKEAEQYSYEMDACEDRDYTIDELFKDWIVPWASAMFRKEITDYPIRHRERFFSGDDVLYYSAAEMGKVHGFSDSMSVYRVHVNSLSRNKENEIYRLMIYPRHCINIYRNFPSITRSKVRSRIALHLHHKMNVDHRFWHNVWDALRMLYWDKDFARKDIKQRISCQLIPYIKGKFKKIINCIIK